MRRRAPMLIIVSVIALLVALVPAFVLAQDTSGSEDGLLVRINGPVTIEANETIDNVIVIGDDATVHGTVTGTLIVVEGDAIVTGQVGDDVTVVRGTLELASTAVVDNVSIIRGDLVRDTGATVSGSVTEGDFQVSPWDWGVFWAFLWIGGTLVILVAGLVFAGIGARQLKAAGNAITRSPLAVALGIGFVWFVLPILMFIAFLTIVGAPLGIGYFLFVLPVIWFLGYLVAGTQLGRLLLRSRSNETHPYLAALLGLIILQLIAIIPVIGTFFGFLAGVLGSGALIAVAWHAWRGPETEPVTAPAPGSTIEPAV